MIVVLALGLSMPAYADDDLIKWSISEDGTLTITGEGIIPNSYHPWLDGLDEGHPSPVKKIVFTEGITEIGSSVINYRHSAVRSVVFPNTLKKIGSWNFEGLGNLESVHLPDGLLEIERWCFCNCDNITSVIIPRSITHIGWGVFTSCHSLLNIYVEDNNQYYYSRDGVLFDENTLLCYPIGKKETSYTIPDGIIGIEVDAFRDCGYLEELFFPDGLCSISRSFQSCKALSRVELPETLTYINEAAFGECESLRTIIIPDNTQTMGDNIFPKTTIIICSKNSTAEYYAKKNGNHILYRDELQDNCLPSSIMVIEEEAFLDDGFKTIFIPSTVLDIGHNAFSKETIIVCASKSFADLWARENGYNVINI